MFLEDLLETFQPTERLCFKNILFQQALNYGVYWRVKNWRINSNGNKFQPTIKHSLLAMGALCALTYGKNPDYIVLPVAINTKEVAEVVSVSSSLQKLKLTPAQLEAAASAGQSQKVAVALLPRLKVSTTTKKPIAVFAKDKNGVLRGVDVVIKGSKETIVFSAKNTAKAFIITTPHLLENLDSEQLKIAYMGLEKREGFDELVRRTKKAKFVPQDEDYEIIAGGIAAEIEGEIFESLGLYDEEELCEGEEGNVVKCNQ